MGKKGLAKCSECGSLHDSSFGQLSGDQLATLDTNKTCNIFRKGQVVFHEGNRPAGVYCLKQGKVKIYKTGQDGRQQIVRLAKPGDLIGYRSFLGEEVYSASASPIEDAVICFIDRDDFFKIIKDESKLSWELIQKLSHELHDAEEFLRDMAQKTVRERLALVLLILHKKFGTEDSKAQGLLAAKMTREELASFVGTATETLIRLLSDFKDEGLVETEGRSLRLKSISGLSHLAGLSD